MKRFSVITVLLLGLMICLMGCGNDTSSTDAELSTLKN